MVYVPLKPDKDGKIVLKQNVSSSQLAGVDDGVALGVINGKVLVGVGVCVVDGVGVGVGVVSDVGVGVGVGHGSNPKQVSQSPPESVNITPVPEYNGPTGL